MKKIRIFLAVFAFLLCGMPHCFAQSGANDASNVAPQMEALDLSGVADAAYNENLQSAAPEFDFNAIVDDIVSGANIFQPQTLLSSFLKLFCKELYQNIHILLTLIVLAIVCAILTNLQGSFERKGVGEVAFLACYILFLGLLVQGFYSCTDMARSVIADQVVFLKAAVPTYIGLLMSTGGVTTAAGLEPVFLYCVQLIGSLMEHIMLPMVFWMSVLHMVNHLSDKFHVTRLVQFIKQTMVWALGALLTFFVGILSLSGFSTSVIDGVGVKTMKYAVGNFVPVVGGLLSDTMDTVLSSTLVLKNALGVTGVIVMLLICLAPILKMLALIGMYKLTAGVIEPISDKRIVALVSSAASSITFLFLMVVSVTIMFVLSITIVIGFGNLSSMLR